MKKCCLWFEDDSHGPFSELLSDVCLDLTTCAQRNDTPQSLWARRKTPVFLKGTIIF